MDTFWVVDGGGGGGGWMLAQFSLTNFTINLQYFCDMLHQKKNFFKILNISVYFKNTAVCKDLLKQMFDSE